MPSVITPCGGGGGGGGIDFDTYPQAGNWLYVETGDATGSPFGRSFEIHDTNNTSSSVIEIRSDVGEIDIDAGGNLALSTGSGRILMQTQEWLVANTGTSTFNLSSDVAWNVDGDFTLLLARVGESFRVYGPGPVLRVRMYGNGKVAMPGLPTVAGLAGELYVDASGFVKRA